MSCNCGGKGTSGGSHGGSGNSGCGPGCGGSGTRSALATGGGFVRPRFFGGQLLTEDDLSAIVSYQQAKNRLHNRYLAGDGVVCGLTVSCTPRRGVVRVHSGYAIDCCGNDVVVPCDDEVDINELIASLPRLNNCDDPCPPPSKRGADKSLDCRTYTVVLHYNEVATELTSAYPTDQEMCQPSGACEAARVVESYRFELRCGHPARDSFTIADAIAKCLAELCPEGKTDRFWRSALNASSDSEPHNGHGTSFEVKRLLESNGLRELAPIAKVALRALVPCVRELESIIATKGKSGDAQAMVDLRDRMIRHLESRPQTDCTLLCEVVAIRIDLNKPDKALVDVATKLLQRLQEIVVDCICAAVNPPCAPCEDTGIVLATVCVSECDVIEICNAVRRFVVSGPALRYWVPAIDKVSELLEELCCTDNIFGSSGHASANGVTADTPHNGDDAVAVEAKPRTMADAATAVKAAKPKPPKPDGGPK